MQVVPLQMLQLSFELALRLKHKFSNHGEMLNATFEQTKVKVSEFLKINFSHPQTLKAPNLGCQHIRHLQYVYFVHLDTYNEIFYPALLLEFFQPESVHHPISRSIPTKVLSVHLSKF
jgi:hypothetical protein